MTIVREFPDGYRWASGGAETDDHLAFGGHEVGLGPIMQSLCSVDKVYVNIGAHVGTWAIRMAKHSKTVSAIEANPLTAMRLQENIFLNNLGEKVFVIRAALWDVSGETVSFVDANGKNTGGSTRLEAKRLEANDNAKFTTTTSTLDSLTDMHGDPIGLISMDVEGAEARILRGAKETINAFRPNLLIELHEGHPGTDSDLRGQVYATLDELGYWYTSVHISDHEEHLVCRPAELTLDSPVIL